MAFKKNIKTHVFDYVQKHLPKDSFYENYFWFISDPALKLRLEDEFKSARFIYKLLEGLQVTDELLVAQCKIQILLYASIYEAVLHHVLLIDYSTTPEVQAITAYTHKKKINISQDIEQRIIRKYSPSGAISVHEDESRSMDERKIVFEDKAEAAKKIGLIDQNIKDIICDIYSMRNAIHLHAEIRRGIYYDLEAAKKAYWYLQGFTKQIGNKLEKDHKATRPSVPNQIGSKDFRLVIWLREKMIWLRGKISWPWHT